METIKCGACGEENRMPVLYCRKCGAKLDYGKAEKALRRSIRWWWVPSAGRFLRGVLLLAVLAGLGLALWPERRTAETGMAVDARRYEMQRALLEDALNRGKAAEMEVAARDFNAFLARNVQDAGSGGAWAAKYRGAGVAFGEGRGEAWLEMERGPLTLTCGCEFVAEEGELHVTGAKFGHLSLPGALGRAFAGSRKDLKGVFEVETRILGNLESAELREGVLSVRTRGAE